MRKTAIVAAFLFLAGTARAASPGDVVINEVAWMGTSNFGDEWIELYNNTGSDIDLSGWYILDDGSATYLLDSTSCAGGNCTIPAGGYFVIEDREEAISDVTASAIIDISLGNSGDSLELFDDNDNSIDLVDCASGWYAGDNSTDSTMERRDPTVAGNLPANWGTNDGVTINGTDVNGNPINGTPGAQNSVFGPLPGPQVAHIHCLDATAIDVVFNTDVEQASAETVSNYTLNAGGSDINPGSATLDTNDAKVVHLTGLAGLNDGDLTTLTVTGVLDAATGTASNDSAQFLAGIVDIATVRADSDNNYVPDLFENSPDVFFTVTGLVTAAGSFDGRESFLQDQSGGLAIFDQTTTEALQRGDEIRISGLIAHYRGKDEITSCRFSLLSQNNPLPVQVLTLAELAAAAEQYESMLVGIASVSNTGGGDTWPASGNANLEITDDGGTTLYTLRIDSDTGIPGNPEPSWPVNVLAIAGQYTSAVPPNDGYQLLPRDYNDFLDSADDDCDGLDDDLDGLTDEDADLTQLTQCGACGNDCTALANTANQSCDTSGASPQCAYDCADGFADCNGDPADGCEVPLGTVDNCSGCGDSCLADNASASTCDAGSCTLVCDPGYDDCNSTYGDGCETQLYTDENCASCGDDCTSRFANATGVCDVEGGLVCLFVDCRAGFGDCDGILENGCEAALNTTSHCGDCSTTCEAGQACIDEGSGFACTVSCQDADGDDFADAACGGSDCDDSDAAVNPTASELCDGRDNNCDGATDEDWPELGTACDSPDDDDLCTLGTFACTADGSGVECQGDIAQQEACNGRDDDCDGETDEDWPELGDACDGPDDDQCADGNLMCNEAGNGLICNDDDFSHVEDCNGADDDCDGETDEGFGEYTCGTGVCSVTVSACVDGQPQGCVPSKASPDYEAGAELTCNDGLDNDCDGYTDAEDTADCGTEASGCGCAASSPAGAGGWLMLLLGLLLLRRRN